MKVFWRGWNSGLAWLILSLKPYKIWGFIIPARSVLATLLIKLTFGTLQEKVKSKNYYAMSMITYDYSLFSL